MDPLSLVIGALVALALALVAFVVRSRWMPAAQKMEASAEHELAKIATEALAKLVDKRPEASAISAAQARMALKDQLVADIRNGLPGGPNDLAKAAGTPLPTIQP